MRAHLIEILARDSEGVMVPVRAASVNDSRVCALDGYTWNPAIVTLPVLRYDFFGGAFQNAVSVPRADFTLATEALATIPPELLAVLRFGSARVQIWSGEVGAPLSGFRLRFAGEIKAEPSIDNGLAKFSAGAADAWLDVPVMATYAGSGGLEGPEDLTGAVKPLVLGDCRFVPGVLIDPVDNVYQVSAYGPVQAISAAYDRLGGLGASSGDHSSLAALLAASIPNGSWATCLALGLVRLGAPADGKVSFHVAGDAAGSMGFVTRAGGMMARLAELAGGVIDPQQVAQLDSSRAWDQARVLSDQTTARQVIQELADAVAAVTGISWTGKFFVRAYGFATPTIELDTSGTSEPLVGDVSQQPVDPPFWRLATTAAPSWVVHDLAEIASDYPPRGLYSAARVYRMDDLVSASDGRSFVYINATPAAGNAPPVAPATTNAWWSLFNGATAGAPAGTSVAGRDAEDVASTIAAGGGVDTDQVSTDSIQANAVTAPYFVTTGVQSMSLATGRQAITGLSFSANIAVGDGLDIDFNTFPMWAGTDGTRFSMDAYLLRDGVDVATFGQVMDTNDMATNNQGGFAVPAGLFARVAGNGSSSTYGVEIELKASRSESNSGGSKTFVAPLDFRLNQSQFRGRRYSA